MEYDLQLLLLACHYSSSSIYTDLLQRFHNQSIAFATGYVGIEANAFAFQTVD